jgi:hypothetical protein
MDHRLGYGFDERVNVQRGRGLVESSFYFPRSLKPFARVSELVSPLGEFWSCLLDS